MATLTYAGTDFTTTLLGLPQIDRRIVVELHPDSQTAMRERHIITLTWDAVPTEGQAINDDQSDLAALEAAVEALADDGALIYARNSGDVYWAYNSAGSANNHLCPKGIKITLVDFPHSPAAKVTHQRVVLTFEAEIYPCSNDPINGVSSLAYTVEELWDTAGLAGLTYSGTICACDGQDPRELLESFIEGTLTPDARERYVEWGANPGSAWGPSSMAIREHDQVITCVDFRVGYGGGTPPTGLEARSLRLSVLVRIVQNWVTITITGFYGYRGAYTGTGTATATPYGASAGTGGWIVPRIGWGAFGAGLGSSAGSGSFGAVWAQAWAHAGINANDFAPPGSGVVVMETDPQGAVNTDANEIAVTKTYHCRWIHHQDILTLDASVEIHDAEPVTSVRVLMNDRQGTRHRPFVGEAGWDEIRVTFSWTVRGLRQFYEMPEMLTPDRENIWRVKTSPKRYSSPEPNQRRSSAAALSATGQAEGLQVSVVSQSYLIRDPAAVSGIDAIVVNSIRKLAQASGGGAPLPVLAGAGVGEAHARPR